MSYSPEFLSPYFEHKRRLSEDEVNAGFGWTSEREETVRRGVFPLIKEVTGQEPFILGSSLLCFLHCYVFSSSKYAISYGRLLMSCQARKEDSDFDIGVDDPLNKDELGEIAQRLVAELGVEASVEESFSGKLAVRYTCPFLQRGAVNYWGNIVEIAERESPRLAPTFFHSLRVGLDSFGRWVLLNPYGATGENLFTDCPFPEEAFNVQQRGVEALKAIVIALRTNFVIGLNCGELQSKIMEILTDDWDKLGISRLNDFFTLAARIYRMWEKNGIFPDGKLVDSSFWELLERVGLTREKIKKRVNELLQQEKPDTNTRQHVQEFLYEIGIEKPDPIVRVPV